MAKFTCVDCGQEYPNVGLPYLCPSCGGIFTLSDLNYNPEDKPGLPGMWQYKSMMGVEANPECYLGEGLTSLVDRQKHGLHFFAKLESLNPSGSFKDRNSAVVTSFLKARGIKNVVEDSSGNAGASLALYSAGFDVNAQIFVPAGTTGPKVEQILACGAMVEAIHGPRENAHQAALAALNNGEKFYASHAMLPFGLAGYATIAFEIFEQLGRLPDAVYCPIGHGSLFYGILLGFKAICEHFGIVERPKMVGVQPERCAPLASAWNNRVFTPSNFSSLAEGTMVTNPVRGREILQSLVTGFDDLQIVSEEDIDPARIELAEMGIFVEPTSAMVYAALKTSTVTSRLNVLVFSGNGLKYRLNK